MFTVKNEEEFLKAAQVMIDATQVIIFKYQAIITIHICQKESGCIHYQLYKDMDAEKSYAMIETWASAEQLEAHSKSSHVAEFRAKQMSNLEKAEIKKYSK